MNVMKVHANDLEITDNNEYEYILTYSYPCQDLSLAGKRKGMAVSQSEGGTRSGLLWEVERILQECHDLGEQHKPNILIMENVPQVHSEKDLPYFKKWITRLEELGYTSFYDDLNGKDLSKADVSVNIFAHLKAQEYKKTIQCYCAIGDKFVKVQIGNSEPVNVLFAAIVDEANKYIQKVGGFEKFAEYGLIR